MQTRSKLRREWEEDDLRRHVIRRDAMDQARATPDSKEDILVSTEQGRKLRRKADSTAASEQKKLQTDSQNERALRESPTTKGGKGMSWNTDARAARGITGGRAPQQSNGLRYSKEKGSRWAPIRKRRQRTKERGGAKRSKDEFSRERSSQQTIGMGRQEAKRTSKDRGEGGEEGNRRNEGGTDFRNAGTGGRTE